MTICSGFSGDSPHCTLSGKQRRCALSRYYNRHVWYGSHVSAGVQAQAVSPPTCLQVATAAPLPASCPAIGSWNGPMRGCMSSSSSLAEPLSRTGLASVSAAVLADDSLTSVHAKHRHATSLPGCQSKTSQRSSHDDVLGLLIVAACCCAAGLF